MLPLEWFYQEGVKYNIIATIISVITADLLQTTSFFGLGVLYFLVYFHFRFLDQLKYNH